MGYRHDEWASATVSFHSNNKEHESEFSASLESIYALEHIGLTKDRAEFILQQYRRGRAEGNSYGLVDYIFVNIPSKPPGDAREAMTAVGLRPEVQDAILDPEFKQVFQTEPLGFWICDTLEANYRMLERLEQPVCAQEHSRGKAWSTHFSKEFAIVKNAGRIPQNHQALYLGLVPKQWLPQNIVSRCHGINLLGMFKPNSGDFTCYRTAWYFMGEHETAELYRKYAARRCLFVETWTIRILVPNTFFASLKTELPFNYPDWKEFVWMNRGRRPPPFSKFSRLSLANVLIGHIVKRTGKIELEEVQQKLSEDSLLTISTGKASQWAFMEGDLIHRLGMELKGYVHIDVHEPLKLSNRDEVVDGQS